MNKGLFPCVALATLLSLNSASSDAATPSSQINKGTYAALDYVVSASAVCGTTVGSSSVGTFYYPGPGKAGATSYAHINRAGIVGVVIDTFPVTPLSGVLSWSGAGTQKILTNLGSNTVTGSFVATFTVFDQKSFAVVITFTTASGCVEKDQLTFVPTS